MSELHHSLVLSRHSLPFAIPSGARPRRLAVAGGAYVCGALVRGMPGKSRFTTMVCDARTPPAAKLHHAVPAPGVGAVSVENNRRSLKWRKSW